MALFMPILQISENEDNKVRQREDKQYEILYKAEIQKFVDRSAIYEANKDKALR
jgi:hypothetical protein